MEEVAALCVIRRTFDVGVDLIDAADAYGNGDSERLVGRALAGRDDAFVATKVGVVFEEGFIGAALPTA